MTKARRLVPLAEITDVLNTLKTHGFSIENLFSIDIRENGVTFSRLPVSPETGNSMPPVVESAYDRWKRETSTQEA